MNPDSDILKLGKGELAEWGITKKLNLTGPFIHLGAKEASGPINDINALRKAAKENTDWILGR